MAKTEDVLYVLDLFHKNNPAGALEEINRREMGLFGVVRYLYVKEHAAQAHGGSIHETALARQIFCAAPAQEIAREHVAVVSSKEISTALHVSSARMTVMLKNLEQKGLIVKLASATDARAVEISLSEKGRALAQTFHRSLYGNMEKVVDEFGVDEVQRLFEMMARIKQILHESKAQQWEGNDA